MILDSLPGAARVTKCIAVIVLLALAWALPTHGQPAPAIREDTAEGFRYLVLQSGGGGVGQTLPMIIGLHYSGATPEEMLEYFNGIGFPARIILPQGPYPRRSGHSWFSADYARLGPAQQDEAAFEMARKLASFVDDVRKRHSTRGKPVVMGISYGGDMSLLLAIRHPDSIAAAFPIAARLLPGWMPSTRGCHSHCPPIRAMHGAADTTVPMQATREAMMKLARMGYDATLTQYPGVAHDFAPRMQRDFSAQVERVFELTQE